MGPVGPARVIITIVCSQDLQVVNQEKTTNYHPRGDRAERQVSHEKHKQNRNYKEIVGGRGEGGGEMIQHFN